MATKVAMPRLVETPDHNRHDAPMDQRFSPRYALILLIAINLFNYVDRQILAAVVPPIQHDLQLSDRQIGWTPTAFLVSYMLLSPLFGFLADRMSRWALVGIGVGLWSLASGASGLATSFTMFILTRCFVGIGEAAYGPVAPTLLSDLYPIEKRGQVLSWFYMAIPVGSALGYVLGGTVAAHWSWRWAFGMVVPPGLLLCLLSFMRMRDEIPPSPCTQGEGRGGGSSHLSKASDLSPSESSHPHPNPPPEYRERGQDHSVRHKAGPADYLALLKNKSYVLDTLGMTAMTFALAGIGFWMPKYVYSLGTAGSLARINTIFGLIVVVSGFLGTLAGGLVGDWLKRKFSGAYFLVSAAGMAVGFPIFLLMLRTPFPFAWVYVFLSCFCLFFNTGPTAAILANVTHPSVRATAFAANILIIHLLGDAVSPEIIGRFPNLRSGFAFVSGMMALGALLWLWGALYLKRDTEAVDFKASAIEGR
jgi:MFS family permease